MCRSGLMACDWAVQNANNVIGMLLFLTTEIVQPFMRKELADRIAAMLNDWLLHLVGPRSQASHATDDMHQITCNMQPTTQQLTGLRRLSANVAPPNGSAAAARHPHCTAGRPVSRCNPPCRWAVACWLLCVAWCVLHSACCALHRGAGAEGGRPGEVRLQPKAAAHASTLAYTTFIAQHTADCIRPWQSCSRKHAS